MHCRSVRSEQIVLVSACLNRGRGTSTPVPDEQRTGNETGDRRACHDHTGQTKRRNRDLDHVDAGGWFLDYLDDGRSNRT